MKNILLILLFILTSCTNIPSSDEIESDIASLNKEIESAIEFNSNFSGGLLSVLATTRLAILNNTKSMLEQKNTGLKRFIPITYKIDGKNYSQPENKDELLLSIEDDLADLNKDLLEAKAESARYSGGLLQVLALTKLASVENSIVFLNQRKLLLKHDIPYYALLPEGNKDGKNDFKPTEGKDIDKF